MQKKKKKGKWLYLIELQRKFVIFLKNKIKSLDNLILESKSFDFKTTFSFVLVYGYFV